MSESKAEETYRKGMVNESMNMTRSRINLFTDEELSTLRAIIEYEMRDRDEQAVAAYSESLPF